MERDDVTTYLVPTAAVARAVANAKEATHAAYTLWTHCRDLQQKLESHLESQSEAFRLNATGKSPVPLPSSVAPVSVLMACRKRSRGRRSRRSRGRGSSSSRSVSRSPRPRGVSRLVSRSPRPRGVQRRVSGGRSRRTHTQSPVRNLHYQSGLQSQALGPRDSRDPGIDAIRKKQEQRAERRAELHDVQVPPELERLRFKAGPPP